MKEVVFVIGDKIRKKVRNGKKVENWNDFHYFATQ